MPTTDFFCPNLAPITGSSSATGNIIAYTAVPGANRFRSGVLRLSGTWVGPVLVQASHDGTNFFTVPLWDAASPVPAKRTSAVINGFYMFNVSAEYIKVTWTRTSGTVSASLQMQALPFPEMAGASLYSKTDLSATKAEIKATGGVITSIDWYNAGNAAGFLQVFNKAAADVTVGSTTPDAVFVAKSTDKFTANFSTPLMLGTGITIAAATSATGSSALSAAGNITVGYY